MSRLFYGPDEALCSLLLLMIVSASSRLYPGNKIKNKKHILEDSQWVSNVLKYPTHNVSAVECRSSVEDVTDNKFDAVTDGVGEKNVDCDKERDTG